MLRNITSEIVPDFLSKWLFVIKFSVAAIIVFIVVLYLTSAIIVPGLEAIVFTGKFIAIPLTLAALCWACRRWLLGSRLPSAENILGGGTLLFFVSLTAVKWLNAAFLTDQILVIEGTVTKLEPNRKSGSWAFVRSSEYADDFGLIVPPVEFEKLRLSQHFGICFHVGWLGIPFRWNHHHQGACSFIHLQDKRVRDNS